MKYIKLTIIALVATFSLSSCCDHIVHELAHDIRIAHLANSTLRHSEIVVNADGKREFQETIISFTRHNRCKLIIYRLVGRVEVTTEKPCHYYYHHSEDGDYIEIVEDGTGEYHYIDYEDGHWYDRNLDFFYHEESDCDDDD